MTDAQVFSAIIILCLGYIIWDFKRVKNRLSTLESRLDVSHHTNFKIRLKLNRVVEAFKNFRAGVFEVLETSFNEKTPVTQQQLDRLKKSSDPDELIKDNDNER